MTDVAVLIPVLNRPERVQPLLESLYGSERDARFRSVFILSKDDDAEREAVEASESDYILMARGPGPGDYARKINSGVEFTDEDWVFLAADDLCFCPGWADQAIACAGTSGKRVIGTNDLGNQSVIAGRHSTHTLVHRSYCQHGTFDDQSRLLHEGYDHNYVDVEFVQTASFRGEFHPCRQSHVEHLHPFWNKGKDDATYKRGREGYQRDAALWRERQRLMLRTPQKGGAVATA